MPADAFSPSLADAELGGGTRLRARVQALHEPEAIDYPTIFREHDSELLA